MNTPNPNAPKKPEKEETLAERSARLEAEAEALASKDAYLAEDPLAPQPLPEEDPDETEDGEISGQAEGIITALQDEVDKAKDQTARALAEAENTRRRAQKEREDASKYAVSGFAKDILDVSDNLRRALEAVPEDLLETEPRLKNLVEGIEATERTLLRGFEKHGIKKLEPMDEPFDPNFHEVMFESPAPGKPAGTIMQIMEPGYTLHDRLLRPARVGVVKDEAGSDTPPGEAPPGGHIDTEA